MSPAEAELHHGIPVHIVSDKGLRSTRCQAVKPTHADLLQQGLCGPCLTHRTVESVVHHVTASWKLLPRSSFFFCGNIVLWSKQMCFQIEEARDKLGINRDHKVRPSETTSNHAVNIPRSADLQ